MHQVTYSLNARADLRSLDYKTAQRIIKKLIFFSNQKNPLSFAKKLVNSPLGQFRFRIGDYRAVFDVMKNGEIRILFILHIKHRKDIYNLK